MLPDLFTNPLASLLYDLLKVLISHPPRQEDLLRELRTELRRQGEALRALQAVLTRFGAPQVVKVKGDVSGSVILLGNGNQVVMPDQGRLAQRWLAWQGEPAEARRAYLETLAALYARHTFPLSKLSFQAELEQLYQPPLLARYAGEWRPSLRRAAQVERLEGLFSAPSPAALIAPLGEGKSTSLRYLAWVYAARPEGRLPPGPGERLPFLVTARRLHQAWQQAPDPLTAWAEAAAGEYPLLEPALVRRVLEEALAAASALLLLDAVDEARLPAEARADFLNRLRALLESAPWRGNLLLLTSRPHALLQSGFSQFAIQEMSAAQVQRLAYRLGRLLLEERARQGLASSADPPPEAALERLTRLAARAAPARFGTPFYVTLLVLAALRSLDLEHGLAQAESLRRLAELYDFFLRQTLNWEREKPAADRAAIPEERLARLALAETAWEAFADPQLRAALQAEWLPEAERAAALAFLERAGLLWHDEISGDWEFTHQGFLLFGVALYLRQAWANPSLRLQVETLHRQTALTPEWADVWDLFFGLG